MNPTAAVILAAGGGTRFAGAGHKLLAEIDGRSVVARSVGAAIDACVGPVIVVWGAVDVRDELEGLDVTFSRNEHWASGQASSLRAGIGAATSLGVEVVFVGLGDQPFVPAAAWQAVAHVEGAIVSASFGGRARPPVRLERSVWPLLPRVGDDGARALMADRPDLVATVEVDGEPADIDTLADLQRWS